MWLHQLVPAGTLTWGARLVALDGTPLCEFIHPRLVQLRRLSKDHAAVVMHPGDRDQVRRLKVYSAYLELWTDTI